MCGLTLKLGVDEVILCKANIDTGEASSKIEEIARKYNELKADGEQPVVKFEQCFD